MQEDRIPVRISLDSPDFSCDHVQVREVQGKEAIGRLFSFDVEIVCIEDTEIPVEQMLGASASLVFLIDGVEQRTLHGMIAAVEDRLDAPGPFHHYRLRLVPRLHRATLIETQEVFLNTSVPDLIRQKLTLVGLAGADVEMRLFGTYPEREMIVQYKETDLAFISRLVEHLGISFFFEHGSGRDVLVFTDGQQGFAPLPAKETVTYRPRGEQIDLFELSARAEVLPASYVMQEYNYRTPQLDLTSSHESPAGFAGGVVEYGAHFKTPEEGQHLAQLRAEERASRGTYYVGRSDECRFIPGATFKIDGHPRLDGTSFLVVEVEHHAVQPVAIVDSDGREHEYRNTLRLNLADKPYRPTRATQRPRIHGVVTAVVEPEADGEIGKMAQLDEQGRYTVRFTFDSSDVGARKLSSRPIRMIQPHAGPNYGHHFPLKPGIEVLMVFLDGDPDRPLILGSVPNPITPSPVTREVNLMHRIETSTGIIIEMRDAPPRG
ncbi:type VI secretion system Vgr family protein [Chondromyces apiculatus]|uniref:VgrG protein n=1 Tax=Chondromyces apiculatus DSM 436 TaxID=1192034 RepID=A0A017T8V4_9BACT|nr:type VI secretion system tip protein TssI/VgrG [Chondromyces apiculatus]EYF05688.1 VgrG protein [Chondromyces apiculatus DSM 436]